MHTRRQPLSKGSLPSLPVTTVRSPTRFPLPNLATSTLPPGAESSGRRIRTLPYRIKYSLSPLSPYLISASPFCKYLVPVKHNIEARLYLSDTTELCSCTAQRSWQPFKQGQTAAHILRCVGLLCGLLVKQSQLVALIPEILMTPDIFVIKQGASKQVWGKHRQTDHVTSMQIHWQR